MVDRRKRAAAPRAPGKAATPKRASAAVQAAMSRKATRPVTAPGDATMTDKAYALLEELIVTLQLPPGAVLSEIVLAKRLATGRTPIREALQRLSRDGLVNILPRRGVLVSDIDLSAQLRLLEVRRELERLMARGAAKRATPDERQEFAEIARGMRLAADKEDDLAFMRLDQQFNLLIATSSRNEFAMRAMGVMHGLSRRFWYQHYKQAADLPLAARLHAEVAEAVAVQDIKQAGAASDALMSYIESFARSTL
ncbi:GntR family transcriptional regulator [Bradyrhizobium prioriisuperbiae]|uniref:GntR family transcriptional regulator n=1 Tax=Bradyrhizobium prioriisuperbiae TaxID=2854389 RepID=UPI00389914F3